ncbi:hypothetical protein [Burkholderia cepacia]|nr:hypothetical protein [Burkholderia cepacia]
MAASILTAAYFMRRDAVEYADLGVHHFEHHDAQKTVRRLLKRLADLGCHVKPVAG